MTKQHIDTDMRMSHHKVPGLSISIINNGVIESSEAFGVLEAGRNNRTDSGSIFNACSISKLSSALLALKLVDAGILDLDEHVNDRLTSWKVPENHFTENEKVTLRRLLSHQAGFIDPDNSFGEYKTSLGIPSLLDLLEGKTCYYPEIPEVKYVPGSNFVYSDLGFCIIEQLIEDTSNRSFKELMIELIFKPLNMKNSTLLCSPPVDHKHNFASGHNKDGELVDPKYPTYPYPAAAGLWSTPMDLAALVIEIIDSLKGKSKLGISQKTINEMITPQGCSKWTGLGVFLDHSGDMLEISSLGWGVGFQCMMIAFPHSGTGAVIMTNSDSGVHQTKGLIGEIAAALSKEYGWSIEE